jgi:hypothetical protein
LHLASTTNLRYLAQRQYDREKNAAASPAAAATAATAT